MLETTEELVEYCEQVISTNSNSPEDFRDRILSELDNAHKTIVSGGGELNLDDGGQPVRRPQIFPWAKSVNPQFIKIDAPIITYTASVTNGSKTITLNTTYPTSLAGYYIKFMTNNVVYKIASHTGGTATLTLLDDFTQPTTAIESVAIFKLEFTFTGVLVPLSKITFRSQPKVNKQIDLLDKEIFKARYDINCIQYGEPCVAGSINQDEDYNFTVMLNTYPEYVSTISLELIGVPATLAIGNGDDIPAVNPIIPKHRRLVIAELTCSRLMKELDDDRADTYFKSAKRIFDALVADGNQFKNRFDSKFARIVLSRIAPTFGTFRFMRKR